MVADIGQRFLRAFGNFAEQQALEAGEFEYLPLILVQGSEPIFQDSPPFLERQTSPRAIQGIGFGRFQFRRLVPVVKIPQREILPAVQTSMVGVLKNPGLDASPCRIELVRLVEDFKKDILHQIFRLAWIPENSQGNS
jgi:hypothetical protein